MKQSHVFSSEKLQSKVIDFLRIPLAVGVVVIHSSLRKTLHPEPLLDYAAQLRGGAYDYTRYFLSYVVFSVCVPAFYLISGYLFFREGDFGLQAYKNKLKKRFRSILLPFLLWNLLYLLFHSTIGLKIQRTTTGKAVGVIPWLNDTTGDTINDVYCWIYGLFVNFNSTLCPIDVPFWFIRDLIVMIVLAPLIYGFVKLVKPYSLFILIVAWLTIGRYTTFPGTFLRTQTLFFAIGATLALTGKNLVVESRKVGNWVYALYALSATTELLTKALECRHQIHHRVTILLGVIVLFKFGTYCVERWGSSENVFLQEIKNTSFFIYAFHWALLYWLSVPLCRLAKNSDLSLIVIYFVQIVLGSAICIMIGILLNRFVPGLMKVLNGR